MAGITGMGTTFGLPNFVGDLFSISPESTPFLSAIGGLTGGRAAFDSEFAWQFYDLRDPDDSRQKVEGDDAPTAEERVRQEATNVLEIHQESVSISYTRLATSRAGSFDTTLRGDSPVKDELRWQVDTQLKQVALDVNASFITGTYAKPVTNATARKTRGLLAAITTNVKDMGNTTPDAEDILDLFQIGYDNGAEPATRAALVNSRMQRLLTKLFVTDPGLQPLSRNVGGVALKVLQTDFGDIYLLPDRAVPQGTLIAVDMAECAPRFLEIPGKGHFFAEPLAKTGASDNVQLYGEIGLEYGNERKHAKLVDATTPYDAVGVGSGS